MIKVMDDYQGHTVYANSEELELMDYCDTHKCEGAKCPYYKRCEIFELTHDTVPCCFEEV